ncbi:hypothetical protein NW762_011563 [Fusarium torreyae]|uniref:Major facilitator superfamily (MFS) profile domain-containing protein n=1 Tax=Fusarium torreyae TaxID=1237075 RepID=A0A9W8RNY6_9HYPO|nr:hypothetical protein NW762_011563 [Fusarium torreyae]
MAAITDDKLPVEDAHDTAMDVAKGSVHAHTEYDEYLDLCRDFTGQRLQLLVRKVDWHVLPQLIIIYLMSYVDRTNVGNAKLFGAIPDMGMTGQDWNTALSVFFVTYAAGGVAGAFSGLLAYGIGHLDYTWGFRGWRFIYCIEGLFSLILSILALWVLNDTPAKITKWLTPEEKKFLVLRNRFAAGGETGIAEKEEFSWKAAKDAFTSFHIYAVALMEFTLCVTVYGYSFILPTINLGYTAANAQAMTAPPYIFACIVTVFSGWAADRYKQRMLSVVLPNSLAACGFIIMMVTSQYPHLPGVTLFGVFLTTAGLYPISPAVTAWIALNCAGSMRRAVGIGAMISFSQLGGIVGSNIYIAGQAPTYPVGFGISLGMLVVCGIIWPIIYYFILKGINQKRAAIPLEEIQAKYTEQQLSDMGDRSPLFRYST